MVAKPKPKIDCVGGPCALCGVLSSCLRAALLTKDGEYVAYTDLCYRCAVKVATAAQMEPSCDNFLVYHEREYGRGR